MLPKHTVIAQSALDPNTLPVLLAYYKEIKDFLYDETQSQMVVRSKISFQRLIYHQLAAVLGLGTTREKGSQEILVFKPMGFSPHSPDTLSRMAAVESVLETGKRVLMPTSLDRIAEQALVRVYGCMYKDRYC